MLQDIAYDLPNAFNDVAKGTKFHISAMNTPTRFNVPKGCIQTIIATKPIAPYKQGITIGSKYFIP